MGDGPGCLEKGADLGDCVLSLDARTANAAGEQLIPAAESVEDAVLTLERRRAAAAPVLSGTVRVSTGECAAGFLARCLLGSPTTALPSGITLELVFAQQEANLARREADMALRHEPPESGDFYISKAGTFGCAVYRRRGADSGAWVTYPDEQAHYGPARWVQRQVEETGTPVALRASSMLMHVEAIRAGTARGVLPCYVGDDHPLLERLTPPIPEIAAEYWIIVHRAGAGARAIASAAEAIRATAGDREAETPGGTVKHNAVGRSRSSTKRGIRAVFPGGVTIELA